MSTPRVFKAIDNTVVEPLTFVLQDAHTGRTTREFRITAKPRLNAVSNLALQTMALQNGQMQYDLNIIEPAMVAMIVEKAWDPAANDGAGDWIDADDRLEFLKVLRGDEWTIRLDQLQEILRWMIEETIGHPTGAPSI